MVTLNFSLSPEASAKLHDMFSCLAKFSDTVSLEAKKDQLVLVHFLSFAPSILIFDRSPSALSILPSLAMLRLSSIKTSSSLLSSFPKVMDEMEDSLAPS